MIGRVRFLTPLLYAHCPFPPIASRKWLPNVKTNSVKAADGGPGVGAHQGRKLLEAEPRSGLIGADLKRYAFAENIDGQLEILERRRAERERLLCLWRASGIGEARERQVSCPFDKHGEITE